MGRIGVRVDDRFKRELEAEAREQVGRPSEGSPRSWASSARPKIYPPKKSEELDGG
jgi:hypothetical protein